MKANCIVELEIGKGFTVDLPPDGVKYFRGPVVLVLNVLDEYLIGVVKSQFALNADSGNLLVNGNIDGVGRQGLIARISLSGPEVLR
jgi:hypothetical protein